MAALIGYLEYGHHAGVVHRLAHRSISAKLATWHGAIVVLLDKEGNYSVDVNRKQVAQGNVNNQS